MGKIENANSFVSFFNYHREVKQLGSTWLHYKQWLKCNGVQGNAVPPPIENG